VLQYLIIAARDPCLWISGISGATKLYDPANAKKGDEDEEAGASRIFAFGVNSLRNKRLG